MPGRPGQTPAREAMKNQPLSGMEAVVLAAGFGERLRPLSLERPKCLFPVMNRPLLEVCLEWLASLGVVRARINAHHLRGQVEAWLGEARLPLAVELSPEPQILGTGGGIRQAAAGLTSTFAVVNADCLLWGADVAGALALHRERRPLATLLLQETGSPRSVTLADGLITSLRGRPEGAAGAAVGFSGFHLAEPELAERIPEGFSDIIEVYLASLDRGARLCGHLSRGHYFRDVGTPESYLALHRDIFAGSLPLLQVPPRGGLLLGEAVALGEGCRVEEVVAGAGARFGARCLVRQSVVWEGAEIAPEVEVAGCVVGQGARVSRSARGEVLVAERRVF
jgi:mannose-1-phosphate guanylyltransferase